VPRCPKTTDNIELCHDWFPFRTSSWKQEQALFGNSPEQARSFMPRCALFRKRPSLPRNYAAVLPIPRCFPRNPVSPGCSFHLRGPWMVVQEDEGRQNGCQVDEKAPLALFLSVLHPPSASPSTIFPQRSSPENCLIEPLFFRYRLQVKLTGRASHTAGTTADALFPMICPSKNTNGSQGG
jgi:hypothetical protein